MRKPSHRLSARPGHTGSASAACILGVRPRTPLSPLPSLCSGDAPGLPLQEEVPRGEGASPATPWGVQPRPQLTRGLSFCPVGSAGYLRALGGGPCAAVTSCPLAVVQGYSDTDMHTNGNTGDPGEAWRCQALRTSRRPTAQGPAVGPGSLQG